MEIANPAIRTWNQTLSVAALFWAGCLALVALEVTFGSNVVLSGLFFFSIPLLVTLLTWVNLGMVFQPRRRRMWTVFALGATVLVSSTVIILVGLVAATKLKNLLGA